MIGSTAKAEQFQTRSGSESTKGSRKGFSLLGGGDSPLAHLAPEERRASLVAHWKWMQIELAEAKTQRDLMRVKRIGVELAQLGLMINELRPKWKDSQSLSGYFMEACKKSMTRPQYQALVNEARRLQAVAATDGSAV